MKTAFHMCAYYLRKRVLCTLRLLLLLLIFTGSSEVLSQTIAVSITPPDTIGACMNNRFKAEFTSQGQHNITISASVNFNGPTINACGGSSMKNVFIVLDSSSATISNSTTDTINGSWTGSFNTTGTVAIYYFIYIDCSVINTAQSTQNLQLNQVWTDANSNIVYNLSTFPAGIMTPLISNISPTDYFSSYLDTSYLYFYFRNSNFGTANILFNFIPDSNYCSQFPILNLEYYTPSSGQFLPLTANSLTPAVLYFTDTLVIRQQIFNDSCITPCPNTKAIFTWQCNTPATENVFCNSCINVYEHEYQILNGDQPKLRVDRISPPNNTYDNSCFNDTTNMVQWEYRIELLT